MAPTGHLNPASQNAALNMGTPANLVNGPFRGFSYDTGAIAGMQPQYFNPPVQNNALAMQDRRTPAQAALWNYNPYPPVGTPAYDFRRQSAPAAIGYLPTNLALGGSPYACPGDFKDEYEPDVGPLVRYPSAPVAAMMRDPMASAMMVANGPGFLAPGQMMMNVQGQYLFIRPYSYVNVAALYPSIRTHVEALTTIIHNPEADMSPLVDILTKRTPEEMEALRLEFFRTTHTQLYVAISNWIEINEQRNSVKYALMGLVLGPALFDLWLLQNNVYILFFTEAKR